MNIFKSLAQADVAPLYVIGKLPAGTYVAVAGARDASEEGVELARRLGRKLAEEGYVVVTGLARGVDEAAVAGALEAGGVAVGVAPFLYEKEGVPWRRALRFLGTGRVAVVSERLYPSEDPRRDYALRNRVVAQLAVALLVPEARYRSKGWGTLHSVRYAVQAGKPVVAIRCDEATRRALASLGAAFADGVENALEVVKRVETKSDEEEDYVSYELHGNLKERVETSNLASNHCITFASNLKERVETFTPHRATAT